MFISHNEFPLHKKDRTMYFDNGNLVLTSLEQFISFPFNSNLTPKVVLLGQMILGQMTDRLSIMLPSMERSVLAIVRCK